MYMQFDMLISFCNTCHNQRFLDDKHCVAPVTELSFFTCEFWIKNSKSPVGAYFSDRISETRNSCCLLKFSQLAYTTLTLNRLQIGRSNFPSFSSLLGLKIEIWPVIASEALSSCIMQLLCPFISVSLHAFSSDCCTREVTFRWQTGS